MQDENMKDIRKGLKQTKESIIEKRQKIKNKEGRNFALKQKKM